MVFPAIKKSEQITVQGTSKSFREDLEVEFFNNFESEHTRKSYRNDITQLLSYLKSEFKDICSYDDLKRLHIVQFKNFLISQELAPKSINRKLAANSSFFDFLIEKGIMHMNPCSSIRRPRQEVVKPTQDLSDEEIERLFHLMMPLKGPASLHKAVIFTLFSTGIRKSELINLRLKHFYQKSENYIFEIRAKGGKQLIKTVHPQCVEVINEYLEYLKTSGEELHPEDWIFRPTRNPLEPNYLIKPLNPKSIDYIVKTWCKKAGIDHRISPHSARSSYIGSAIDAGVDLYRISRDVGHSSVKTTEEYNKRKLNMKDSPVFSLKFLKKQA